MILIKYDSTTGVIEGLYRDFDNTSLITGEGLLPEPGKELLVVTELPLIRDYTDLKNYKVIDKELTPI